MHEDLLRHIWSRQLFGASQLKTTDDRIVQVVNPGTLQFASGPDFRNAVIDIGGITYRGDVEFHRTFDDWHLHHHHIDPNYNSVILHVVLIGPAASTQSVSGRKIPTLVLEDFLSSSIEQLTDQLAREEFSSRNKQIACASSNNGIDSSLLHSWIRTMYRERLQEKTGRMHDRLCEIILTQHTSVGEPFAPYNEQLDPDDVPLPDSAIDPSLFRNRLPWEQLLFEMTMDALGYSNNRVQMKKLAETISILQLIRHAELPTTREKQRADRQHESSNYEFLPIQLQSILFHASGLLPDIKDIRDQDSKVMIHQLRAAWNELSHKPSITPMHPTEWNFSPTRPSNFPTIRIAAAGVFLQKLLHRSLFKSLITVIGGKYSSSHSKIEQLMLLYDAGDDSFWNYHYSFNEATHKKHSLLGESRRNDILVNVVVPFVCLYANVFGKKDLAEHCLNLAIELPLLEDNSILQRMNKQLIKGKVKIECAFQQQGLIHLYKRYCIKGRCGNCEVGKIVLNNKAIR